MGVLRAAPRPGIVATDLERGRICRRKSTKSCPRGDGFALCYSEAGGGMRRWFDWIVLNKPFANPAFLDSTAPSLSVRADRLSPRRAFSDRLDGAKYDFKTE